MQNLIPKLRQTFIISKKPGFLSEKSKTLTSSNYHRFYYFLLKLCTCFLLSNVYKRVSFRVPILKNIFERLLLKMFMELRKVKNRIFQHQYQKQVKMYISSFSFMVGFLWSFYLHKYFYDEVSNKLQKLNIYTRADKNKIKRSRK